MCRGSIAVGFHVSGGCFETDGVVERGMCMSGGRVHGTGEAGRFERSRDRYGFLGESVRGGLG